MFQAARHAQARPDEGSELAILGENGEILYAATEAMRLFEATSRAELQRALGAADSPNARRLRHLCATLPIGGPPRLERMRFSHGRGSTSVNLLCSRVSLTGGTALVLSAPASENSALPVGSAAEPIPSDSPAGDAAAADALADRGGGAREAVGARFLWTLNSAGRFGVTDPLLIAALGAAAPRAGETLAGLRLRAEIERADEFAWRVEKRETFFDLTLAWRSSHDGRKLRLSLSAAPIFDGRRDFAGYRGFGILNETIAGAGEPLAGSDAAQPDREALSAEFRRRTRDRSGDARGRAIIRAAGDADGSRRGGPDGLG